MSSYLAQVEGAGLGLRRSLMEELWDASTEQVDFFEIAPENWIGIGGKLKKQLAHFTERHPFVCHGLSLSIGSPAPLNVELLKDIKQFLADHQIKYYSEHLSYSSDSGQLYDLLPIPFTEDAVVYVAERIARAQDILGQQIAMENASYYCAPQQEMSESEFINAVVKRADCALLLDVNNIYVNSVNHQYDAEVFLKSLPLERTAYIHVAGHYQEKPDLLIDTHGMPIIDPVWELLEKTYALIGSVPTLLERDFNIPNVSELFGELNTIQKLQNARRA